MSREGSITYRPGDAGDSYAVFYVFEQTLADLNRRLGNGSPTSFAAPRSLARMWAERRSLYDHLALTADLFWIAEQDGRSVGFARSIVCDNLRQLTEFFVLPDLQSGGVGRALLDRAFPAGDAQQRCIVSSPDVHACQRYCCPSSIFLSAFM